MYFEAKYLGPVGEPHIEIYFSGVFPEGVTVETISRVVRNTIGVSASRMQWPNAYVIAEKLFGRALVKATLSANLTKLGLDLKSG